VIALVVAAFGAAETSQCPGFAPPEVVGHLDGGLSEVSGLVAGRGWSGLWVHNDSGDQARFYAIGTDGTLKERFELLGVRAEDWEDMAIGPGPAEGAYLYLGDIGDNFRARAEVVVWRVAEPRVDRAEGLITEMEALKLRYPDRSRGTCSSSPRTMVACR
jgi:hypothetical protein